MVIYLSVFIFECDCLYLSGDMPFIFLKFCYSMKHLKSQSVQKFPQCYNRYFLKAQLIFQHGIYSPGVQLNCISKFFIQGAFGNSYVVNNILNGYVLTQVVVYIFTGIFDNCICFKLKNVFKKYVF